MTAQMGDLDQDNQLMDLVVLMVLEVLMVLVVRMVLGVQMVVVLR